MLRNETKLMESAIALAEELHFQRAARRVGISQPMLTKNIQDLEAVLGGPLFRRDRKTVSLSDAGRAYIQHARLSMIHAERALQAAKAAMQDEDLPMYIGRSPYVDPFLVTILLSIQLPLFPRLRIHLVSQYSVELVQTLLDGGLDLAIANEPPESALLTQVQLSDSPLYVAISHRDPLANQPFITWAMLSNRRWMIFERRLHPAFYDNLLLSADLERIKPHSIETFTSPEESFPFIVEGMAVAFLVKPSAVLFARNGVTVRPLSGTRARVKTYLLSRADNDSKLASELVRTYMKRLSDIGKYQQMKLPITA